MAKVEVRDLEIAYNTEGSGEPVVLIGGFTAIKESWELQVAALAKHFRVITFDNRGAGETTVPTGPFSIADMAADTVGLMDALGIDSAHFFGVSMGGSSLRSWPSTTPGESRRSPSDAPPTAEGTRSSRSGR